jgi:hypothetical protein
MRDNSAQDFNYKSLTTNSVVKFDTSPERIISKDWSPAGLNASLAAIMGVQAIWR